MGERSEGRTMKKTTKKKNELEIPFFHAMTQTGENQNGHIGSRMEIT